MNSFFASLSPAWHPRTRKGTGNDSAIRRLTWKANLRWKKRKIIFRFMKPLLSKPNLTSHLTAPSKTTTTTAKPLKPTNDVIPIAVGATLGSIVLITLVVYAIGRWRIRQVLFTTSSAYRILIFTELLAENLNVPQYPIGTELLSREIPS